LSFTDYTQRLLCVTKGLVATHNTLAALDDDVGIADSFGRFDVVVVNFEGLFPVGREHIILTNSVEQVVEAVAGETNIVLFLPFVGFPLAGKPVFIS